MTARIRHVTVDCTDPYELAQFWAAVTGWADDPGNPNFPADPEALLISGEPGVPGLLFVAVPEGRQGKNRIHLDLQPQDRTRDDEVARLLGIGATQVADFRKADGTGWAVLADPEGNEFCVERSAAERG